MEINRRGNRRGKWWLALVLFLLIASNWIADRLDAPTWIDIILIAVLVVVLPWAILAALREARDGGPE